MEQTKCGTDVSKILRCLTTIKEWHYLIIVLPIIKFSMHLLIFLLVNTFLTLETNNKQNVTAASHSVGKVVEMNSPISCSYLLPQINSYINHSQIIRIRTFLLSHCSIMDLQRDFLSFTWAQKSPCCFLAPHLSLIVWSFLILPVQDVGARAVGELVSGWWPTWPRVFRSPL